MTPKEESRLRALLARATPTPWAVTRNGEGCRTLGGSKSGSHRQAQYTEIAYTVGLVDDATDRANAALIVAAVNELSTLLAERDTLRCERDEALEQAEAAKTALVEAEERGYKRGLADECAAWEEDEATERARAVWCCTSADAARSDATLDPVTRARRVLMARCDRYEYVPNYLAAVADIDALIAAVRTRTLQEVAENADSGRET